MAIVRLLASAGEPLSAKAIADQMKIAPSACQSILHALESEEFVFRHPRTLKYSIGIGVVNVASRLLHSGVSLRAIQEELDAISASFGVTAVVNEIDRAGATVVGLSFGGAMFGARLTIGRHVPALVGASGRCYAAHAGLGRGELQTWFKRLQFECPPSFEQWIGQVEDAKAEGVGRDEGQYVRGYTNIAVPVFEGEEMRRSVVAIFASEQLAQREQALLVAHLQHVGRRLST